MSRETQAFREVVLSLLAMGAGACFAACVLLDGLAAPLVGIGGMLLLIVWLVVAACAPGPDDPPR
jgi:hypothetical protein